MKKTKSAFYRNIQTQIKKKNVIPKNLIITVAGAFKKVHTVTSIWSESTVIASM